MSARPLPLLPGRFACFACNSSNSIEGPRVIRVDFVIKPYLTGAAANLTRKNKATGPSSVRLINTKVLSHFITKHGGKVAVFQSPPEAVESAKQTPCQTMLLALYTPELDGYELAQTLQELQPCVPLIALSADDSSETIDRVKSAGFQFFLRKPFLPHELIHILTKLT